MDIDYYHIDNIVGENVITLYPPNTPQNKKIKPIKVSIDYVKNELNENNSVFLKSFKRLSWSLFSEDRFIPFYFIIDNYTYDKIMSGINYLKSYYPLKIGDKGYQTSLLMGWSGVIERISKLDFLYPNRKLGVAGTGTSLLALSYKALEVSNNTDKIQIKLRRNINNL